MESEQSIKQRKIALATSEHASVIVELMKDILTQSPLIADTEWQTIVNAITLDVQSSMMRGMVEYIERIRQGELHDKS